MSPGALTDPVVFLYAINISVWGRWSICTLGILLLVYRPGSWYPHDMEFLALPAASALVNAVVHHRILTKRTVSWHWILFLSIADLALITQGIFIGGGYQSFMFVAYFPAIVVIAMIFASFWLSLAWTTIAAVVYTAACLMAGSGLDLDVHQDKVLIARLTIMYTLVLGISFIVRFERFRWQNSVTRERQLHRERIEISQTIHDTVAQTAYLMAQGIHRARQLAGGSNEELAATLDATLELSRSTMWEVRGPIDAGHIVEGRDLGRVLWSHCATFETITGIPAALSVSGTEPRLATETRTRLFSIAHNALTNALQHAQPSGVEVSLSFETDHIRLSVSDDGVGLPPDYAERGRGFNGMREDADRMGGRLIVESAPGGSGTTITCLIPHGTDNGGV